MNEVVAQMQPNERDATFDADVTRHLGRGLGSWIITPAN
jgi:hypothetical protein